MTVGEIVKVLEQVDPERTVYIHDLDDTAQPVAAIVDMQHVNYDMPGVKIPDDVAMLTTRMMSEFENIEEDEGTDETNPTP